MQIRVAVADDHAFFRKLICDWLSSLHGFFDFEIAGEAKNGLEAIDLVNEKQPDLLLLDLSNSAMETLSIIAYKQPVTKSEIENRHYIGSYFNPILEKSP